VKYVQIFTGADTDAEEGALNWPWVPADSELIGDRVKRARAAAREHVDAELAKAKDAKAAKPKAKAADDA
jgi:hypothetical protein